jgi:hypothetical protein
MAVVINWEQCKALAEAKAAAAAAEKEAVAKLQTTYKDPVAIEASKLYGKEVGSRQVPAYVNDEDGPRQVGTKAEYYYTDTGKAIPSKDGGKITQAKSIAAGNAIPQLISELIGQPVEARKVGNSTQYYNKTTGKPVGPQYESIASGLTNNGIYTTSIIGQRELPVDQDGNQEKEFYNRYTGQKINPRNIGIILNGTAGLSGGDMYFDLKSDGKGNISFAPRWSPRSHGFLRDSAIGQAIMALGSIIPSPLQPAFVAAGVVDSLAHGNIAAAVVKALPFAIQGVTQGTNLLADIAGPDFNPVSVTPSGQIAEALGVPAKIADTVGKATTSMVSAGITGQDIGDALIKSGITSLVGAGSEGLKSIGKEALDGIKSGLSTLADSVSNGASELTNNVSNGLSSLIDKTVGDVSNNLNAFNFTEGTDFNYENQQEGANFNNENVNSIDTNKSWLSKFINNTANDTSNVAKNLTNESSNALDNVSNNVGGLDTLRPSITLDAPESPGETDFNYENQQGLVGPQNAPGTISADADLNLDLKKSVMIDGKEYFLDNNGGALTQNNDDSYSYLNARDFADLGEPDVLPTGEELDQVRVTGKKEIEDDTSNTDISVPPIFSTSNTANTNNVNTVTGDDKKDINVIDNSKKDTNVADNTKAKVTSDNTGLDVLTKILNSLITGAVVKNAVTPPNTPPKPPVKPVVDPTSVVDTTATSPNQPTTATTNPSSGYIFNWNQQQVNPARDGIAYGQAYFNPQWTKQSDSANQGVTQVAAEGGLMALDKTMDSPSFRPTMVDGGIHAEDISKRDVVNQTLHHLRRGGHVIDQSLHDDVHYLASKGEPVHHIVGFMNHRMAKGGITSHSLGSYSDGGHLLKGPGDGMSDDIPATIAGKQPARLANEEFVIPADVVSHLGNGSSESGAKVLYEMMARIRKARTGNPKQGKQIDPHKLLPKV